MMAHHLFKKKNIDFYNFAWIYQLIIVINRELYGGQKYEETFWYPPGLGHLFRGDFVHVVSAMCVFQDI